VDEIRVNKCQHGLTCRFSFYSGQVNQPIYPQFNTNQIKAVDWLPFLLREMNIFINLVALHL
jgi:hypothetical protein